MGAVPAEFFTRLGAYAQHLGDFNLAAGLLGLACVALIVVLRRWRPSWPGFLIVVSVATLGCLLLALPVETIGSRFGSIPAQLPHVAIPHIPLERTKELFPSAFTIAFLAGVESLLSAVVADGMIGGRHRSNCELVAQGVANVASALVGGLPATGALARTATNVRSGARSPVAAEDVDDLLPVKQPKQNQRAQLPEGVEVYQVSGPLFFAVANRLDDVLNQFPKPPRVFILRMRLVPLIDVSGVNALRQLLARCARGGTRLILSGPREQPRSILLQMGVKPDGTNLQFARDFDEALIQAR
jgi:MFS superfamily sulfate permease-like transporter